MDFLAHPRTSPPPASPPADPAVSAWVAAFLAGTPPRAKSLVATVFGDALVPHGGAVWMGCLIDLLAPFGVNERLVRTSVFRLGEEGVLESRREGRAALYSLTIAGRQRFDHAQTRIYAPGEARWDGHWTIVVTSRGWGSEAERTQLRRELEWQGFAAIGTGIFAHPSADEAALREILAGLGVLDAVHVVRANDMSGFGARPTRGLVGQCWDLEGVAAAYRAFIAAFEPVRRTLDGPEPVDPLPAFQVRTLLIHAYRRAILHDPRLPLDMLPADWPGRLAYDLCRDLYGLTAAAAQQHLAAVFAARGEPLPPVLPLFGQRFGGL